MFILFCLLILMICLFLVFLFFLASKSIEWDFLSSSGFECGFSSWFFSRFSFSIHYFIMALIFLFLDLELCLIFPLMNFSISSVELVVNFFIFVSVLVMGLLIEWAEGKLSWLY